MTTVIDIYASKNGDKIEPSFKIYVIGNEDNIISEDGTSSSTKNIYDIKQNKSDSVTVSAYPKYNVQLVKSGAVAYRSYFNLKTGEESTSTSDESVFGRMLGYGVTIMLYNTTDNPNMTLSEKKNKGIELPYGDITFDVTISATDTNNNVFTDKNYYSILWEYNENLDATNQPR